MLASAGRDQKVRLWDVASGKEIRILAGHSSEVESVKFSPDGNTLASASNDGTIKLWEPSTGREIRTLKGHTDWVWSVAFSPDGKRLVSGGHENTIKLWDITTGRELKTITGNTDSVLAVVFSPNGNQIVSGAETTVKIWDTETGKLLANLTATNDRDWLVTTPEGFFDGTPAAWKQLIWRFNNNTYDFGAVELYFNDFFHPNLLQDVIAGRSPVAKAGKELNNIDRRQPIVKVALIDGKPTTSPSAVATDKRSITVRIEVSDDQSKPRQAGAVVSSGAQDLRLFRNGSLVRLWHGDIFKLSANDGCHQTAVPVGTPHKAICEAEVPISADKNEFTAYAFNRDNVKSNDSAAVMVIGAASLKRQGSLYVLAVGVNKYDYPTAEHNLTFAVPDIDSITAELETRQARLKQYAETRIIKLTNENTTKSNIMLALGRFLDDTVPLPATLSAEALAEIGKIRRVQPEDAIVIYYSGHGTASGDRFYLIPHDGFPKNAVDNRSRDALLQKQSISDLELAAALENVQAGQILLVIDACHSGAVEGEEKRRGPMNSRGLAQLAYEKGMFILTASQSFQSANEAAKIGDRVLGHGFLTFELLEAMNDKAADKDRNGTVVEREWFDYAVEHVPTLQQKMGPRRDTFEIGPEKTDNVTQTPRIFYPRDPTARPFAVFKP